MRTGQEEEETRKREEGGERELRETTNILHTRPIKFDLFLVQ